MSARTSPIKRLNLDVLWHIFDINADTFDDDTALRQRWLHLAYVASGAASCSVQRLFGRT